MKFHLAVTLSLAGALFSLPAVADDAVPSGPRVVIREHTFVVRLDKPQVLIDIKRPTAAAAAGAAHESLRAWVMRLYEPAALRSGQ